MSITAVVVTYQPDAKIIPNLRRLAAQVSKIIVVDNGSGPASAPVLETISQFPEVELVRNDSNLGIAVALNIGIRRAREFKPDWIATFDQDSAISAGFFEGLFRAGEACPKKFKIGMLVPAQHRRQETSVVQSDTPAKSLFTFVATPITSGSVIKSGMFSIVGEYDDGLFIDLVDIDYCLRLRRAGFKIVSATGVTLTHQLGFIHTRKVLFFPFSYRTHSPWRYYYIMRNRILLYRRHGLAFPGWVLKDVAFIIYDFVKILFWEDKTLMRLRLCLSGLWDGWRGRSGRHAQFPAQSQ
ncbi:MAG TPA: glycosyltransferase family 2 protein [Verrucomicrobiae bacterium]|nr:glycosyltransferase family 2 protein [Verrucomicrobiae bacterium]